MHEHHAAAALAYCERAIQFHRIAKRSSLGAEANLNKAHLEKARGPVTSNVSERIAIVGPSAEAVANLRQDLIAALTSRGHRVLCLTPPGPARYGRVLRGLGAQHRMIEPPQPAFRALSDWQELSGLIAQFKDWQPNVVMGFGLQTLTHAARAARRADVRRVVSLVNTLPVDGLDGVNRRRFAEALRESEAIVFHNAENQRHLARLGLIPQNAMVAVVPGSGVDLEHYAAVPLPPTDKDIVFLMLARLERSRGVLEFKAAAERIKAKWPRAAFRFAGPESTAADAVTPAELTASGVVEYLGLLEDVRPALAACHVFVYPSHAEGMPRAVLEALATGRPVITTRTPGCAATVDEKVSGCLVPAGDAGALAVAIESYLAHLDSLPPGARAARLKAERRFSVNDVNATLLRVLGFY